MYVKPSIFRVPVGHPSNEVLMEYDPDLATIWAFMEPLGVPCFSLTLMRRIRVQDKVLEEDPGFVHYDGDKHPVRYYIGGSRVPGVYSYGGDLSLFLTLIRARDARALRVYAGRCLDCLWARITAFGAPQITTIALVQGAAFGGGWESALASDVIVAEKSARFMFPEIKFNLFPGMGAFSLLARRVGPIKAQWLTTNGKCYSAEELCEMGLVDVVAPDGGGEQETVRWIQNNQRRANGLRGIFAARRTINPVTRAELDTIADCWVAAALNLNDLDLRVMNRLLVRQQRKEAMELTNVVASPQNAAMVWEAA